MEDNPQASFPRPADPDGLEEVARRYRELLRASPSALAHHQLANIYTRQLRLDDAVSHYRRALDLESRNPDIHAGLGRALRRLGQYGRAEGAFREALRLNPHHPKAHESYTDLGWVLLILNRPEEARECFHKALALRPDWQRALAGEANALQRKGAFEQAYSLLQPVLQSGKADASVALVFAAMCRPLNRCREAVALMERLLAGEGPAVEPDERTMLHFTLGRFHDAAGEYDRAFGHFQRGNASAGRRFDVEAHELHTGELMDAYTAEFMAGAPRAGHGSERPVFIVGMPRSGTSLVEQILASHPDVFGGGELDEIQHIADELPASSDGRRPYPQCLQDLSLEACERFARRYLDHLSRAAPPGARRVTDKMPTNFLHLGLIALLFPGARVIHCLRDPIDTCLSCYFQDFQTASFSYDLEHLGAFYRDYRRLMAHWREVLDLPLMEVRYEDLVADQEGVSRAMVEFCGLEWDERCLRFHETRRTVTTASYDQVRRPLHGRSVGRWRHYERHLGALLQVLGEAEKAVEADASAGADPEEGIREAKALIQAGRIAEADALLTRLCRTAPEDAGISYLSGKTSGHLGRTDEALAHYRRSLEHAGGDPAILKELGTAFLELKRLEDAAKCYEAMLTATVSAYAHYNLATVYTMQRRLDEAVDHYRQALALEPGRAEIYIGLGNAHHHLGLHAQAEASYRKALELNPRHPLAYEGYTNLGTALACMGRVEDAGPCFRRALELKPDFPRAVAGLADALERQGSYREAYDLMKPLVDAGSADANVAVVLAAVCRPLGRHREAIALLERLIAAPGTQGTQIFEQTTLRFALGRLLDAVDEYDAAFACIEEANEMSGRQFDPEEHGRDIDELIGTYTPEFMARAPRAKGGSQRPVFIVGMPRSGTSLVEQILASHPEVFGAGELEEMHRLAADLPNGLGGRGPFSNGLRALTPGDCDRLAQRYLDHIAGLAPVEALRVTDKMPANFLHLGLISLLFPEARVIHCVRDPLDTCLSCYFLNFTWGHDYAYDLEHLGYCYRQYQRLMNHWRSVLQIPMMEVRYEELVADQEGVSRAMVEFCGLPWDERCLRFHETRRTVTTASYDQVRRPVHTRSVGRWRRYEGHLVPLRQALAEAGESSGG